MKYQRHPAAEVFAQFPPPETYRLEIAESIRTNGQRLPIVLTKHGLLADGGLRLEICESLGIEPKIEISEADDIYALVLDLNIHRKHLTDIQRDFAIGAMATLRAGSNQFKHKNEEVLSNGKDLSIPELAKQYNRPEVAINRARAINKKAIAQVKQWVIDGKVKPYIAERAVSHITPTEQATWKTPEDVKHAGRKVIAAQPANQSFKPRQHAKKPTRRYEETLPRKRKRLVDLDIGDARRPSQPIQLWPVHVQDLMDDSVIVSVATTQVVGFVGRFECTVEQFAGAVDRMLAYRPVLGKDNGEQTDFGANARKKLAFAETKIDQAIEWLNGIRDVITKTSEDEKTQPLQVNI